MPRQIREIRQTEIIQAAVEAVRSNGLPLPSYDTIAREAGMSRQLVRHYFPVPEQLMLEVCNALATSYEEGLAEALPGNGHDDRLPYCLDFHCDRSLQQQPAPPADEPIYNALFAMAVGSQPIRDSLRAHYGRMHSTLANEIQLSQSALDEEASSDVAYLLSSLLLGHERMVSTLGFDPSYTAVIRRAMDRIIDSYQFSEQPPGDGRKARCSRDGRSARDGGDSPDGRN